MGLRPRKAWRKVDLVLAVGIWMGFGPELGSEKNSPKINKKVDFLCILQANSTLINKDISMGHSSLLVVTQPEIVLLKHSRG